MAGTSQPHPASAPCENAAADAATSTTLPAQNQSPTLESKAVSPIANRVCTPLGLFVHPAERGPPISMPQTLTPESGPASPTRSDKVTTSTSPIRQAGTSPTRSQMPASECMRRRTDSISDTLRAAAANTRSKIDDAPSPLVPAGEMQPLHTGTVLANTKMVHPKPINRMAPADVTSRPGTASSVAQLEMTAQQLSMTSSIDDAIRDLHGELKRSDSRRSSVLAASLKNGEDSAPLGPPQLKRHLSSSSSIVSTNIAARQGGYSPAAFVKSPSASGSARLIPGSLTAPSLPELETPTVLSRHGPGKSSVRSVRSAKLSLADISESEPISLTQTVLDEADNAPPLELEPIIHEAAAHEEELDHEPSTQAFHHMMQSSASQQPAYSNLTERNRDVATELDSGNRPSSSHSQDTFHQAQNAFFDFDGVHCPENVTDVEGHDYHNERIPAERDYLPIDQHLGELEDNVFDLAPLQLPQATPQPPSFSYGDDSFPQPPQPVGLIRPQSFLDPSSGVQMNYYPARVPATLNIPQKLSNKPKAHQRNSRQSKVLSVMMGGAHQSATSDPARRASAMPMLGSMTETADDPRPTKERHHERRPSFLPLSTEDMVRINEPLPEPADPPAPTRESCDNLASTLRIPKRISEPKVEKRKSRMSMMGNIPAQLRASAYFDSPALTTDIEAKDGSAMNALDDILNAGASAPVGAFTDHLYAGKLGSEVYGTAKKPSQDSSPSLPAPPSSENSGKRRSSWMPLGRRSHSRNSRDSAKVHNDDPNSPHLSGDVDSDQVIRVPAGSANENGQGEGEEGKEGVDEAYFGPPSTLLAELQFRKQQQKDRIQNRIMDAHGTQATLLELDAVAETQKNDRKSKRVNLLWEDPDAHLDQNGSDDEDVPLAILAARQQGAKNMADLERPIGLIEKREIEENEPLSKRRARLQGLDKSFSAPRPQSMLMAPARLGDTRPRQSMISLNVVAPEDNEDETLAERRMRLALEAEREKEEKELSLPSARPVSTAFSAELLSQFDPLEAGRSEGAMDGKDANRGVDAAGPEEEETLGQRRRRLQAEKTARQEEMAHGGSAAGPGSGSGSGGLKERRMSSMSMASVLSVHARKSPDLRVQEQIRRRQEEERVTRENDAKMAAMRSQMPSTLTVPGVVQKRGFHNGAYNDGRGGAIANHRPVSAQFLPHGQFNRPNSMAFNHGHQQGLYMNPYAGGSAQTFGGANMYNNGARGIYGGMQPSNQMQMPHNGASMDRVEVWRQGVFP
ncbi:hypothetical protein ISF_03660 [Cordyceps fumosorosea ARSEF 2679]|uniref:Uncharacterized protein n=1 Tax=Cordyceps fumosorosea (strain ARSEF 2679) TaxID=1081104 RepID=A0A167ZGE7_CORFA|nr:hypothetical protein ISF_03660 [Cordyceps fumosorosea ARSEF 2679]OAA67484.1 hypothetical protein ISF_03660 [Cordyceps fumosorosea ARSEF 2679]